MYVNQQHLISNAYTLENFNLLEKQGLDPKLAVSKKGCLVLYSQKQTGLVAKIFQVVKDIFYRIYFAFGWIKIDEKAIYEIKQTVKNFYFQKVKKEVEGEYNSEIIRLRKEHENLSNGISSLKEETIKATEKLKPFQNTLLEFHKLSQDLKSTQEELVRARTTISSLQILEKSLELKIGDHKSEILLLESQCSSLRNKKREVKAITTKYDNMEVKAQIKPSQDQDDYKKRAEQAEARANRLQNEASQLKQNNSSSFSSGFLIGQGANRK